MSDEQRRHPQQLERELAALLVGPTCAPDRFGHCITCSDEALQASVLSVDQDAELAVVALGETTAEVDITLVNEVVPGVLLLIHGGVALAKL